MLYSELLTNVWRLLCEFANEHPHGTCEECRIFIAKQLGLSLEELQEAVARHEAEWEETKHVV